MKDSVLMTLSMQDMPTVGGVALDAKFISTNGWRRRDGMEIRLVAIETTGILACMDLR
jgi:hypothetical protein